MKETEQKTTLFREYLLVLVLFMGLYSYTCAPGILWQDSGMFQYRIWNNDIEGRLGLALAHPSYHLFGILAKWIPWGDFAHKVNLVSAVSGAVAVANLYLLLMLWLKTRWSAVVGMLALGLSWTFWQHCCIAETYTHYLASFMAELVFLFLFIKTRKSCYFYGLALMNGVSLANHMWATIALFCYFWYLIYLMVKRELGWMKVAAAVALWAAGASPYLYLIIKRWAMTGDFGGTMMSAAFGDSWGNAVLNGTISLKIVRENFLFLGLNFCSPVLLFLLIGGWKLVRNMKGNSWFVLLGAMTLMYYSFAFRYTVPDRYAFFMPFYGLASVIIGYGADGLMKGLKRNGWRVAIVAGCFMPIAIYWAVPVAAKACKVNLGTRRSIPYRDEYCYFLRPWQTGYDGPERFGREVLEQLEDDAVIYVDSTPVYTLWYAQTILGLKPGVQICSSHVFMENSPFADLESMEKVIGHRPVYVFGHQKGYVPGFVLEHFDLKEHGMVWEVVPKNAGDEVGRIK